MSLVYAYIFLFSIICIIIGLPMLCMGYLKNMNANNYIIVNGVITSIKRAKFYLKNELHLCRIITENELRTNNYFEYKYPINSNITLYYDIDTNLCRTETLVNNLAITGIFFFVFGFVLFLFVFISSEYEYQKNQNSSFVPSTTSNSKSSNSKSFNSKSTSKSTSNSLPVASAPYESLPVASEPYTPLPVASLIMTKSDV